MNNLSFLIEQVRLATSSIPHSRIHPLKTYGNCLTKCYVKRDDELGFGVSGTKWRKYASLIPYLKNNHYQEVVVIGGAYSNHVLGICQLLIENSIRPTLFLHRAPPTKCVGNFLLTSLLVPSKQIHWIPRKEWPEVEILANSYAKNSPLKTLVIPEGGCMDAALSGALTLGIDILQNPIEFDHIFIDAGTGLSAIATILAFSWMNKKTLLHVLLLAEGEEPFLAKLSHFQTTFEALLQTSLSTPHILSKVRFHKPTLAPSFGSVNSTIFKEIRFLAEKEGFFTDPIYSAKLFWEAKQIIPTLKGNILILHSGGALTLMGFQDNLAKTSLQTDLLTSVLDLST